MIAIDGSKEGHYRHTVNKPANQLFEFFSDVKNMEIWGAIKSVTKSDDDWWDFDHTVAGKGK